MIDHHAGHAARAEHAEDFPGRLRRVRGVMDDAPAIDEVERVIREGKFLGITAGQLAV